MDARTAAKRKPAAHGNIQKRHTQRQRQRIRAMKRRRFIFFSTLILIAVLIVMFFTPLFNIRRVDIEGNNRVSVEELQQSIGVLDGENLFRTSTGRIKKNILQFAYIDTVTVKRALIPPSIRVAVTECEPGGYIIENEKYIIINEKAKVLEVNMEEPEEIPQLVGLTLSRFDPGLRLEVTESDKFSVMIQCLQDMRKLDVLKGVEMISFEDMSNISFNYEDRLDVLCGSDVEFSKKLGLFREAIHSSKLTENSRGTIDLSTTGKAVYTP